jgi:hypothetical protein
MAGMAMAAGMAIMVGTTSPQTGLLPPAAASMVAVRVDFTAVAGSMVVEASTGVDADRSLRNSPQTAAGSSAAVFFVA